MWGEALSMLAQAERLHRQAFQPKDAPHRPPAWEPPVDVLETEREVLILAALPGVADANVQVTLEGDSLVISGERHPPAEFRRSTVHRLEVPYGYFLRRVRLPAGRYDQVRRTAENGCLAITLRKA
jgi:HSP20 family molecular chaperone IbpA